MTQLQPQPRSRTASPRRRRGMVAVQVALCLVPLCGVTAFAIDGGMMFEYRRRVQAASDAAALAAAADLYQHYATGVGLDAGGTAKSSATASAQANGFSANSVLTVNIPPSSGPYLGKAGYAEVTVEYDMPRGFSSIFGSAALPIKARSVARGLWTSFPDGVILLDPSSSGAFSANGNASLNVTNADIVIDSTSASSMTFVGNASATAVKFNLSGSPGYSGGTLHGTVYSGQPPTADPLSYLTPPNPASLTTMRASQLSLKGGVTTINPGVYNGGISLGGNSSLILNPGIYYLKGGGLTMSGNATLTGTNVMIYNDPSSSSDAINLTGNGSVTITPPLTGPYKGISIFQNRTSTAPISMKGNGGLNLTGTIYAPAALVNASGNGTTNAGSQIIAYGMSLNGNGSVNVAWTTSTTANTRSVGLVE